MPGCQMYPALQRPVIFDATAESLVGDAGALIGRTKQVWDHIVASIRPESATWENTISPIIEDENSKSRSIRTLCFYASTSPTPELRDASGRASTLFNNAEVEGYARADMFSLVNAVLRGSLGDLDGESRYYLEKLHRKFYQNGCGLTDSAVKSRFEKSQKRLKEVERECNKNLNEDSTGLWLTLNELKGVPASFLKRFTIGGPGERNGQFWISTKVPQSSLVMKHAILESTRKKVFYAIQNRMPSNVSLFQELILLRDETARLLGYPNHAVLKTGNKMVKNPDTVNRLLDEIRVRLVPYGSEFATNFLDLKKAEASARGETVDKIFFWDQSYYSRVLSEMEAPSVAKIAEYFELHTTLLKLLQMFEHLFDTRFKGVTIEQQKEIGGGKPLVWHDDVLMYTLWDNRKPKDAFMGYAYFDFYPREGKYTHNGHYSLQQTFLQPDGTRFRSSSALVMNYSKTPNQPTLLGIEDVRKLFHEIGHLIHALCTETKYAASQPVDKDFVEAPSLMFEQFFWQARHIQQVSFHYSHISPSYRDMWRANLPEEEKEAAEDLPAAQLQDNVVAALEKFTLTRKNVLAQLKELFFASYDMLIHTPASHEALKEMNLTELFNKTKSDIFSLSGGEVDGEGRENWEYGHGETVFRNVVNGYDAGYYAYILGRVFALDIFKTGFEADSMSKEAGKRYRDMVLRFGGSQPELKTLTDYLGHQPSTEPFFEYLGIATRDNEYGPQ